MTFVREAALSRIARLLRYAVSGGASACTHFGVGLALTEGLRVRPVAASTAGFVASIVVSYVLQHAWVFRSAAGHAVAGTRFLAVTAAAFALNTIVLGAGTEVLHAPYPIVQAVALLAIPVLNYSLNSRWTFRPAPDHRPLETER
ncbi:GtrA family protein [Actinoplanes sp. KI2]|uniref:GtrA family protein n=1 Tax=Actinoplanes sp. KI2 TaxID=2983315 RepID=UPI0021D5DB37|nr:GtrA family protein [Actinoplanes sp. KI2]MCU7723692.1 GtrA family protein [Actinoplanes sp. KI2]